LEAYLKRHPKPKTIAGQKEVLQVTWDSLSSWTNRQSCQRVLKATEGPVLQLRVDISNIHSTVTAMS